MKKICLAFLLIVFSNPLHASTDTTLAGFLLKRIESLQVTEDPFFIKGLFPAYITNSDIKYSSKKKDNNYFSTSIVINILDGVRTQLTPYQQSIVDSIRQRSLDAAKKFENKKGRGTYNFWRQDSAYKFPYNNWVPILTGKGWVLPDDFDDTVMTLMALKVDSTKAAAVHKTMQGYSAYPVNKVIGLPNQYKSIPTYSTWFGKNFSVFYDLCVASNILTFVQQYQLKWTKADSATLTFIKKAIETKDYLKQYKELAPYYQNKAIILYHFSKLLYHNPINELNIYRTQLATDALTLFAESNNFLEQIILCSVISKLGYTSPVIQLPKRNDDLIKQVENNNLSFFDGDLLTYFEGAPKFFLNIFTNGNWHYRHFSKSYNTALLLEYIFLNN
jgi:hypothetical protein